jgi:hypothetical protein
MGSVEHASDSADLREGVTARFIEKEDAEKVAHEV